MMHTKFYSRILLLTPFLIAVHQAAQAATVSTGEILASYTVKLSEKEAVLMDPDDPTVQKVAMWDHPFQRIADRNMPWIEITNESQSTAQITQFLITIGDTNFNFSEVHFNDPIMPSEHNPVDVSLDGVVEAGGNQLVVNFTGFDPGETVRFRIDIDPDDPDAFPHPDFRRVLFDMNGNDPTDNARVQLQFSNDATTIDTPALHLDDYPVNPLAGIFVSFEQANIRPYSWMEPVEVFELGDQTVIPEPSTWSIAVLAAVAVGLWSRRRRATR